MRGSRAKAIRHETSVAMRGKPEGKTSPGIVAWDGGGNIVTVSQRAVSAGRRAYQQAKRAWKRGRRA